MSFMELILPKINRRSEVNEAIQEAKVQLHNLLKLASEREDNNLFLSKFIHASGCLCYITRISDNTVVWINDEVRSAFGNVIGQKCHSAFQGMDEPCDFCNNLAIMESEGQPFSWTFYNQKLGKLFLIKDAMYKIDGVPYRFEIAIDIHDQADEIARLAEKYKDHKP